MIEEHKRTIGNETHKRLLSTEVLIFLESSSSSSLGENIIFIINERKIKTTIKFDIFTNKESSVNNDIIPEIIQKIP